MGSREGDIVLDPFCGAGTTCIAAMMLNRDYIGIEISPEYREIALKRLDVEGGKRRLDYHPSPLPPTLLILRGKAKMSDPPFPFSAYAD
jgi:DNA modification methylase